MKQSISTTDEKPTQCFQPGWKLTPFCVAPNHPKGLYYNSLAAHLTLQRRSGGWWETGTSAPLCFHMAEQSMHTYTQGTKVHSRQRIEHLTLCLSAGGKPIPKRFIVRLLYSMLMLMSHSQESSEGLTPEVQDWAPDHSQKGSVQEALVNPTSSTRNLLSLRQPCLLVAGQKFSPCICKKVAGSPRQDPGWNNHTKTLGSIGTRQESVDETSPLGTGRATQVCAHKSFPFLTRTIITAWWDTEGTAHAHLRAAQHYLRL